MGVTMGPHGGGAQQGGGVHTATWTLLQAQPHQGRATGFGVCVWGGGSVGRMLNVDPRAEVGATWGQGRRLFGPAGRQCGCCCKKEGEIWLEWGCWGRKPWCIHEFTLQADPPLHLPSHPLTPPRQELTPPCCWPQVAVVLATYEARHGVRCLTAVPLCPPPLSPPPLPPTLSSIFRSSLLLAVGPRWQ